MPFGIVCIMNGWFHDYNYALCKLSVQQNTTDEEGWVKNEAGGFSAAFLLTL